jgi:hypothetical protein
MGTRYATHAVPPLAVTAATSRASPCVAARVSVCALAACARAKPGAAASRHTLSTALSTLAPGTVAPGTLAPSRAVDPLIAAAAQDLAEYQRLTAEGKLGEAGQRLEALKQKLEQLSRQKR